MVSAPVREIVKPHLDAFQRSHIGRNRARWCNPLDSFINLRLPPSTIYQLSLCLSIFHQSLLSFCRCSLVLPLHNPPSCPPIPNPHHHALDIENLHHASAWHLDDLAPTHIVNPNRKCHLPHFAEHFHLCSRTRPSESTRAEDGQPRAGAAKTHVHRVRVVARSASRVELDVTERLAQAWAIAPTGESIRLPRDEPSRHQVVLTGGAGRWRIASVR